MTGETDETTCLDFGDECQVASDFYDAGYDAGTKDAAAILTDLIAELQDASTGYDPDCQSGCGDVPGAGCPTHYEEAAERAADRAEQRLREVSE